jgi:hypothetical protein
MNLELRKTGKTNPRFPAAARRYPRFEQRRACMGELICSAARASQPPSRGFGTSGNEAAKGGYLMQIIL